MAPRLSRALLQEKLPANGGFDPESKLGTSLKQIFKTYNTTKI